MGYGRYFNLEYEVCVELFVASDDPPALRQLQGNRASANRICSPHNLAALQSLINLPYLLSNPLPVGKLYHGFSKSVYQRPLHQLKLQGCN